MKAFVVLLIVQVTSIRFCAWERQQIEINQNSGAKSKFKQTSVTPEPMENRNDQPGNQERRDDLAHMNKTDKKFMQYRPHYLHSYSYPVPVTPHVFLGQLDNHNKPIFYLKDNQTLSFDSSDQIFYVNGRRRNSALNTLQSKHLSRQEDRLRFMIVMQIENALDQDLVTSITILNCGSYLGIIFDLGAAGFSYFTMHLSYRGQRSIGLLQLPLGVSMHFSNLTDFDNKLTWMTGQTVKWQNSKGVKLAIGQPIRFQNVAIHLQYASIKLAKDYKIDLRQFELLPNEMSKQSIERLKNLQIEADQYKFDTETIEESAVTCDNQAQRQLFEGLSYQYGTLSLANGSRKVRNAAQELLSFCPSRKRFPWGFLWDDGFHCQVAMRYDTELALKVIKSWLDTMTEDGWIPRQQNRGKERENLCNCPKFMRKDVRDGNPPTLILSLGYLAKKMRLKLSDFPHKYFIKLQKWYKWFQKTQQTEPDSYIFRWYDSIQAQGSFNSGLDDFPRLPDTHGHIDCQSWMYMFSVTMADISYAFGLDGYDYLQKADRIKKKILSDFIDPKTSTPRDFTGTGTHKQYSPHFGYPSILPIAFGILDDASQEFNSTISTIMRELDSRSGITSLSRQSPLYLQNSNAYWRGPVWININYLFLKGLTQFYPSQHQYYQKLRRQVIKVVCGNWQQRGYFYENYIKGIGSFSYPFTGWTALISIIVKENY